MYDVVGVVCVQYLGDSFWVRWSKAYLLQLQERQKWLKLKKNVTIGDVVLIMDRNLRNSWALGRVQAVTTDTKGLERIVEVKTASNVLRRPIHKLCQLLEADANFANN